MFLKFIFTFSLVCVAIFIANHYNKIDDENSNHYKIDDENSKIINFGSKFVDTVINNDSDHNNATTLELTIGSFNIPKKSKSRPRPLGEDAHFISNARNIFGVADGVGLRGIDAGIFARELMANSLVAALDQNKGSTNPVRVLESAFRKTRAKGTSTACIIALNDNNAMRFANLGDSGFILFRGNKLLYRSSVQQHRFNWPYQLGSGSWDTPNMAYQKEIHVEDGDIIVAGTDGLFDNVYDHEIEEILNRGEDYHPDRLAQEIAELALSNSLNENFFSPFAEAARIEGFKYELGGKYDDITVVVAMIGNNF